MSETTNPFDNLTTEQAARSLGMPDRPTVQERKQAAADMPQALDAVASDSSTGSEGQQVAVSPARRGRVGQAVGRALAAGILVGGGALINHAIHREDKAQDQQIEQTVNQADQMQQANDAYNLVVTNPSATEAQVGTYQQQQQQLRQDQIPKK